MSIFTQDVIVDNVPDVTVTAGVNVNNFPATQPVSGTVNIGTMPEVEVKNDSGNPVPINGSVSITGTVNVLTAVASTATLTITALPNTTSTLVLAANANRKSAIIFIPKSATSIKFGSGASATSFTYLTGAANTTIIVTGYTGDVYAFGGSQNINVTELV